MRYRLGPWTPQGDSTQIGVPFKVVNAQPTVRGSYREIGGFVSKSSSFSTVNLAVDGQSALIQPSSGIVGDSAERTIVRTFTAPNSISLYEYNFAADTYTNVTRALPYSGGDETGGSMVAHPTVTLGVIYAISTSDVLQYSSSAGSAFVNLSASAPMAYMLVSTTDFLLAFNGRQWFCSAIGNVSLWTPNISTQAATGTIDGVPGDIVSAKTLRRDVIVYKVNAMYLGQYSGPPTIWQWTLITDKIGADGQNAVIEIDNVHYFFSRDKFYIYDGSFPREILGYAALRNYVLFEEALRHGSSALKITSTGSFGLIYNEIDQTIWITPSSSSTNTFTGLYFYIYHIPTNTFGVGLWSNITSNGSSQFLFNQYGSGFLQQPAFLNISGTSGKVFTQQYTTGTSGTLGTAEFQFGPYGAEDLISHLSRLRLIMYRVTGNVTVTLYGSDKFHGTFVQYYTKTVNSATALLKFDTVAAGCSKRWHKITVQLSGEFEFDGFDLNMKSDSKE